MCWVQVFSCEFIAAILSNDSLEVLHGEVVGIVPAGSLEGNSKRSVKHLVISLIDEGGSEVRFIAVWDFIDSGGRNWAEVGANLSRKCFSVNITSPTDYNIFSNVELVMELSHLFWGDWVDYVSNTMGRMAEIVILY